MKKLLYFFLPILLLLVFVSSSLFAQEAWMLPFNDVSGTGNSYFLNTLNNKIQSVNNANAINSYAKAVDKRGYIYYAQNSTTIAVVSPVTHAVVATYASGSGSLAVNLNTPHGMVIAPDNHYLYATNINNSGSNQIAMFDISIPGTIVPVKNISIPAISGSAVGSVSGININSTGTTLFAILDVTNYFVIINNPTSASPTFTNVNISSYNGGTTQGLGNSHSIAIDTSRNLIYLSKQGFRYIQVWSTSGIAQNVTYDLGSTANVSMHLLTLSWDGSTLYAAGISPAMVYRFNTVTSGLPRASGSAVVTAVATSASLSNAGTNGIRTVELTPDPLSPKLYAIGNQRLYELDPLTLATKQEIFADNVSTGFAGIDPHGLGFILHDFGDAPSSYGNAGHFLNNTNYTTGLLRIGTKEDGDSTIATNSASANFDDNSNTKTGVTDDEDAFIVNPPIAGPGSYSVTIPVLNNTGKNARLVVWADLNKDGDFADAGETSTLYTVPSNTASQNIAVGFSGYTAVAGSSVLRIRLSTDTLLKATAASARDIALWDGEVEDFPLTITTTTPPSLSGNVFDDANGLQDNTVNGTGTNIGGTLYAQLLNSSGTVILVVPVASNGSYSFSGLAAGTYSVVINQSSTVNTTSSLPAGWVNTGEFNGTGTGSDGTVNGISASVTISTSNVTNVNFGIDQLPTANAVTATSQVNPGGNATVQVPTLTGTDPEQGNLPGTGNADTIIINTLPTNGTLYYNGLPVSAGDTIKNYNPALLTVNPNAGAGTVSFTFSQVDAALKSSSPAIVSMPFTTLTLSGKVLDDANGLQDGIVNGTGTNAGGVLYAQLLDNDGNVVATTPVASDGSYSFPNLDAGTYSVVINQSPTASSTPSLPAGWVNTGANNGTGGNSAPNGISAPVTLTTSNVGNINFGVDQLPTANLITATPQTNPGGTATVPVPTLTGSDPEQGQLTGTDKKDNIIINTVPTNGTMYYNGIPVAAGDTIKNYDPSLLTLNPASGAGTVSFSFSELDSALKSSSTPATVSMAFTALSLSGNVFNDANGLQDGIVNGTGTNVGGMLYARLLDNNSNAIATTAIASDGTYSFINLDAGTYSVVINLSSTAGSTPSLPAGWVNTGENNGAGAGSDGNINGTSAAITLTTSNVTNVNFGIDQLPIADPVTALPQPNPGGTATVAVPTLTGSDPDNIIINTVPGNGTLYYNCVAVVAGDTIKNYNPSLLTVDPNSGAGTVSFTYSEVDTALKSSTPASVSMDFTTFTISGSVLDDTNGLQDMTVNGAGTNAGGSLYAQLLDNAGNVIQTVPVASDGSYSFSGLDMGTYSVLINQSNTANARPLLPSGWVSTGEYNGPGAGNDGSIDGKSSPIHISSELSTSIISNINFGIDQTPIANAITTPIPLANPVGTGTAVVPTLHGSDPEQGDLTGTDNNDTIIINTVPSNGTLYYNGTVVMAGDTIKNYDPSLLRVDPAAIGTTDVSFTYSEVDAALVASNPASVMMHFETPLPVALSSFTTKLLFNKVQLNWSSATEINVADYSIERSTDGIHFASIGLVNAKGLSSNYQFEDVTPQQGINYYRLKINDNNGVVTYSQIAIVNFAGINISITSVTPNPYIDNVVVYVELPKAVSIQIQLFDAAGKMVLVKTKAGNAGGNKIELNNLGSLSNGVYIIEAVAGNTVVQQKIVKGGR